MLPSVFVTFTLKMSHYTIYKPYLLANAPHFFQLLRLNNAEKVITATQALAKDTIKLIYL